MKKSHNFWSSDRTVLYGYFLLLITIGSLLLALPVSWSGTSGQSSVPIIDAVFTAVSATCVTGLITIDTSLWSLFGQFVILILIQTGGLGIITFSMFYLVLPRMRISLKSTRFIKDSFASDDTANSRSIIRSIVMTTLFIEGLGFIILACYFYRSGVPLPVFTGLFHAVSAFCNAGFSLFSAGLVPFRGSFVLNLTIILLVIMGGIGFMVIRDIRQKIMHWNRPLLFHSKLMLIATPVFIFIGFLGYLLFDSTGVFFNLPPGERVLAAFFQSVTTRTAGFNTVDQSLLSPVSRWLTLVLMLIGGGSGSTAGGLKVSTAFILFLLLFRGVNERGDIRFLRRRITAVDVSRAAMFFLKAIAILLISVFALGIIEFSAKTEFTSSDLIFECVSALATVGLSTGLTPDLSIGGKVVIAVTMFTGRVGLFSLIMRSFRNRADRLIDFPRGEVLTG